MYLTVPCGVVCFFKLLPSFGNNYVFVCNDTRVSCIVTESVSKQTTYILMSCSPLFEVVDIATYKLVLPEVQEQYYSIILSGCHCANKSFV